MKTNDNVSFGIAVAVFILIISILFFVFSTISKNFQENLILKCYEQNFTGMYKAEGFYVNCEEMKDFYFHDGKWSESCSLNPFSMLPSCHTLCNIDCEIQNRERGEPICVC